jgi:hypothetical protein
LPTRTVVEVMPVWSLKALAGMVRPLLDEVVLPPVEEDAAAVVVVEEDVVELQATAVVPARRTIPSAAMRVFHDAEPKAPP